MSYNKVIVSDKTKEQVRKIFVSNLGDTSEEAPEDTQLRARELDERERRLARKEIEIDEAYRLLKEKLGTDDILKKINELAMQEERQRQVSEELRKEKQQVKQLGNKVSQEVKRAKAGLLREQKKIEQMSKDLEVQRRALEEAQKLMNDQIDQLEKISTAGSMTVTQNLSNRILELTRQVGEHSSQTNSLEHSASQLKEQLTNSRQENNEISQRQNKLKQHRDQLHEQNRALKKRIGELDLERTRLKDQSDMMQHQLEQYQLEHQNSNTDLENLLHNLLDLYRDHDPRGQSLTSSRRPATTYSRPNLDAPRNPPTQRSSVASVEVRKGGLTDGTFDMMNDM